ncbi:hypothetical protein [Nocardia abscessus]|uniref:hypothetical protein n=1 Tax=Nocardia abscessus TaxID=120957 RepID=UPI001E39DFD0|nr:hypothetical protein [Nocardia abscessus]
MTGAPLNSIHIDWAAITGVSRTTLTTHLWTAPPLRRSSPIHDKAFDALRALDADLVRFLPWYSHPRIAVAELNPPTASETFWSFELLDPLVEDFMEATGGKPVVANFATIPAWMFRTEEPVAVAEDPDEIHWDYERGTEFRDPTFTEAADYFYRVASWYIAGGFTDELGRRHESGHHYRFAYWEVLCEPDLGHRIAPADYTRLYDAIVERLRPLDPDMKFVGLSLSHIYREPEYYWHFLDSANHRPGVPVDAFSYHFYASPDIRNPFGPEGNAPYAHWRDIFFARADGFLEQARFIDGIRRRLAPAAKTFVNEIGTYPADVMNPSPEIPEEYWALSAAVQSYLWAELVALGTDLVGIAEFMDYPGMIPGTSLIDWETGAANLRYEALALLLRHFGPGDELAATTTAFPDPRMHAQAFVTESGERKLVVINKSDTPLMVTLASPSAPVTLEQVGSHGPRATPITDAVLVLDGFATAVVTC